MKTVSPAVRKLLAIAVSTALSLSIVGVSCAADDANLDAEAAARIDVSAIKSAAALKYQLKRLSPKQLCLVARKPEKPYTVLFQVMLSRKGVERKCRQEAAEALAKINGTEPAVELINGIGLVDAEDKSTAKELVGLLMAQKPEALAKEKEKLTALATDSESSAVKQAAYAALAVADGKADTVWADAAGKDGGMKLLMGGVGLISDGKVRATFYSKIAPLVAKAADDETQIAAIDAISYVTGHEADAFKALASIISSDTSAKRDAAIRSLDRIPAAKFPKDQVATLSQKLLEVVKSIPLDKRTDDAGANAVQLGKDLSSALPLADGAAIRKSLRGLAPQIVKLTTYREQMLYDTRYFVVEAGKPVQITLENDDAMQHNIVITAPGATNKVALAGANLATPPEGEKAYVPKIPEVLQASDMVADGESVKLSFIAPEKPGEYGYVCTFPGHNERMYGVMLVVADMDKYEVAPIQPTDPLSKKKIESARNERMDGPLPAAEHKH